MTPVPRLRDRRIRAALSQRDLAARSGVALSTIAALETGSQGARPSTIRRLAVALKVQPSDLMAPEEATS
jgi:transcriptional regulator with XRE-family HTH domain